MDQNTGQSRIIKMKFWDGLEAEVDVNDVANRSLSVKGATYQNPLRFLEIYSDNSISRDIRSRFPSNSRIGSLGHTLKYDDVRRRLFPNIPGLLVEIGAGLDLTPF